MTGWLSEFQICSNVLVFSFWVSCSVLSVKEFTVTLLITNGFSQSLSSSVQTKISSYLGISTRVLIIVIFCLSPPSALQPFCQYCTLSLCGSVSTQPFPFHLHSGGISTVLILGTVFRVILLPDHDKCRHIVHVHPECDFRSHVPSLEPCPCLSLPLVVPHLQ